MEGLVGEHYQIFKVACEWAPRQLPQSYLLILGDVRVPLGALPVSLDSFEKPVDDTCTTKDNKPQQKQMGRTNLLVDMG